MAHRIFSLQGQFSIHDLVTDLSFLIMVQWQCIRAKFCKGRGYLLKPAECFWLYLCHYKETGGLSSSHQHFSWGKGLGQSRWHCAAQKDTEEDYRDCSASQNLCKVWHFCLQCLQGILSLFIDGLFMLQ